MYSRFTGGKLSALFAFAVDFLGMAKTFGTPTFNATWWYLSYALLIIFLLPALTILVRKIGGVSLFVISFAYPHLASLDTNNIFWYYAPTLALGLLCAQYNVFERMKNAFAGRTPNTAGAVLLAMLLICALYLRSSIEFKWMCDAVVALIVCGFSQRLDGFDVILNFLGKHSMNMFFMHTFLFWYYSGPLLYSLNWFGAIYLALVLASLACSIMVEALKKVSGFNSLRDKVVAALS